MINLGYEQLADFMRYCLDQDFIGKRFMATLLKASNEEYDQQQRELRRLDDNWICNKCKLSIKADQHTCPNCDTPRPKTRKK